MGYELYREVKVWAPPSLTHREKLTAMVLADDANDRSRLTWNSAVDAEIMRHAMVKNDRDMRKILARLQDEKVIEHAGGGHNGKVAKYRFLHLHPDGCPGEAGCGCPLTLAVQNEPATSPKEVQTGPTTGSVAGPIRTPNSEGSVQKEPPTDGVAGSNWHRSRFESNPPTPLSPQLPPLSLAEQLVRDSGAVADDERETFIDWITTTHKPNGPAWWRTVANNNDFAALAEKWRADQPTKPASKTPAWCGHCGDDNPAARFNPNFRLLDGAPCPDCHPDARRSKTA
ncbi:hypothetical protein GFH48_12805 [Streptomyces fagopyri]|uniref:Uncharacterized protein n=1 Tax=Streptomyces fagopyri TaxID=2662397 RepID=A0A5Q0LBX3_9ACTN|nr:hypothetical protein [Streptomyces fagopyri]QFZ74009.1 hypothetical protein GFH48_12805 [Streptomyces fagopyri]